MKISLRNKLVSICFSTTVFSGMALIIVNLAGGPLARAVIIVPIIGFTIGMFEEFYVRGHSGRWLRSMHPAKSVLIYSLFIVGFHVTLMMAARLLSGPSLDAVAAGEQVNTIPPILIVLPAMIPVSAVAIMLLRIIGYLGAINLLHLMTGKYHRPVLERRIFLFLDIKGSTALVERLGPIETRALIGKFFFDISAPITDHGGEIYRFTGDGIVAVWDWNQGIVKNRIVRTIDAIGYAINHESDYYHSNFSHIPEYRIGVNGGSVVTSEEGDTKRAIGFYGDTIHIAARLEHKAGALGISCILSKNIAEHQLGLGTRLRLIGDESLRGISEPVEIFELKQIN